MLCISPATNDSTFPHVVVRKTYKPVLERAQNWLFSHRYTFASIYFKSLTSQVLENEWTTSIVAVSLPLLTMTSLREKTMTGDSKQSETPSLEICSKGLVQLLHWNEKATFLPSWMTLLTHLSILMQHSGDFRNTFYVFFSQCPWSPL